VAKSSHDDPAEIHSDLLWWWLAPTRLGDEAQDETVEGEEESDEAEVEVTEEVLRVEEDLSMRRKDSFRFIIEARVRGACMADPPVAGWPPPPAAAGGGVEEGARGRRSDVRPSAIEWLRPCIQS
jgi:hypothetical protein